MAKAKRIADAADGALGVGAGAQMGDGAQEFKGVALFLQRIFFGAGSKEFNMGCFELPFLFLARRFDELACDSDRGSGGKLFQELGVIGECSSTMICRLESVEPSLSSIKEKFFCSRTCADPSADGERFAEIGRLDSFNFSVFHNRNFLQIL